MAPQVWRPAGLSYITAELNPILQRQYDSEFLGYGLCPSDSGGRVNVLPVVKNGHHRPTEYPSCHSRSVAVIFIIPPVVRANRISFSFCLAMKKHGKISYIHQILFITLFTGQENI